MTIVGRGENFADIHVFGVIGNEDNVSMDFDVSFFGYAIQN